MGFFVHGYHSFNNMKNKSLPIDLHLCSNRNHCHKLHIGEHIRRSNFFQERLGNHIGHQLIFHFHFFLLPRCFNGLPKSNEYNLLSSKMVVGIEGKSVSLSVDNWTMVSKKALSMSRICSSRDIIIFPSSEIDLQS